MRVLLVDDHSLFRQGLQFLLSDLDESLEFVDAATCAQALTIAGNSSIDLVLLDYHLPDVQGLGALSTIKEHFDTAVVVMLSGEDDPQVIRECIDKGASGFIPKSCTPEVLIAALRLILAGGIYLPRNAFHGMVERLPEFADKEISHNPVGNLSKRQRDVLNLVIQGKANKVVARELDISEGTVKAHLSAAFRALGVSNRTEAVFKAAQLGLKLGSES